MQPSFKAFGSFCIGFILTTATMLSGCQSSPEKTATDFAHLPPERCPADVEMLPAQDSDFGRRLISQINTRAFYPKIAQDAGQAGQIEVCVDVRREGEIAHAVIAHSSGFPLLDGAALYTMSLVNADKALYRMPSSLKPDQADVWFRVPIEFRLQGETEPPPVVDASQLARTPEQIAALKDFYRTPGWLAYSKQLNLAIAGTLAYPQMAQRLGQEGNALVSLVMRRDGQILRARILRSDCDADLDGVVLMSFGLLALQPHRLPFPDAAPIDEMEMQVPFHFELRLNTARKLQ